MGRDPGELYEMIPAAAEVPGELTMLYYLDGFMDAGAAGRQLATHLMGTLEHTEIARFDIDTLLDYRSRRPAMTFAKDHWESFESPELGLHLLRDPTGAPFLLLTGPEPDREWEIFSKAVLKLSAALGVKLAANFHGIPMGVPHTRPLGITGHATRHELIDGYTPFLDRLQVPGSATSLIEFRFGEAGRDAVGFAVHVPHYLAHAAYPAAAVTLMAAIERVTGLDLPTEPLRAAATATDAEIERQVAGSEDVAEVVRSLEQQYDAMTSEHDNLLAGAGGQMPTAEELGAQFERYLAEQHNSGENPDG